MKKMNGLVNCIVVVACVVTCADTARTFLVSREAAADFRTRKNAARGGPKLNDVVNLPGKDWTTSPATLVLAISRYCRFCTDSAPFYKTLFAAARSVGVPVTVITQDDEIEKTEEHLANLDLHISDLRKVSLRSLGITGTPTLFTVDGSGRTTRVFVGTLQPKEERDMIAFVQQSRMGQGPYSTLTK